jgi:YfiH family protein
MWPIEQTPIGRIVVAPTPAEFALFYTTLDFPGRITPEVARQLTELVRETFAIDATLATCNQVHGATIVRAPQAGAWRECDSCDAMWTEGRGTAIAIKVADCLPVTFIDPSTGVLANVHSGWRGAVQNITAATIDAVPLTSSALVYLGPSIRVCCFEVGEEVAEQFPAAFVDRTHAKAHVDLPAFTAEILRTRGFTSDRVFDSGLCTRCEGSIFHSYRRDRTSGRNLAIVAH